MSVLSELELKNARPRADRYEIKDGKVDGLWVRVSPNGLKVFVLKYRFNGRSLRLSIGRYPDLKLAEARLKAQEARGQIAKGVDPQAEKVKERRKFVDRVDALVTDYIETDCKPKKDSWKMIQSSLTRRFVSLYGSRSIHHVTKSDINVTLKRIMAAGKPQAANTAFWYIRGFFNWCRDNGIIEISPCDGISDPAPKASRERVVDDRELLAIWNGAGIVGHPFGNIVKLLILTGQRRTEVAAMRWYPSQNLKMNGPVPIA
jgi:hypothetical protein